MGLFKLAILGCKSMVVIPVMTEESAINQSYLFLPFICV